MTYDITKISSDRDPTCLANCPEDPPTGRVKDQLIQPVGGEQKNYWQTKRSVHTFRHTYTYITYQSLTLLLSHINHSHYPIYIIMHLHILAMREKK